MDYKSIVPTNAPNLGHAPDVRLFSNEKNEDYDRYGRSTGVKKLVQAASCMTEPPTAVIQGSFHNNGFMSAVHAAFDNHLPILIIPDDIWHIFLSQVSIVINRDPKRYRDSFVNHQGKHLIEVRNDSLIMDIVNPSTSTNWETVFPVFEQKMNEKMKMNMNRVFSTTTKTHYTVSQILVMDTMKSYFSYQVTTKCGFPEIRIGGTVLDWDVLDKAIQEVCVRIFVQFGPNYSKFINESKNVLQGQGDPDYWEKLYHFEGARGSGKSDQTTGIVNDLFPVDSKCSRAPGTGVKREVDSFPPINGTVPFVWEYLGTVNHCEFEAGLTHAAWDQKAGHIYCKPTWKISRKIKNTEEEEK